MNRAWGFALGILASTSGLAGTRTWDDKHDTSNIELTVVYFVPSDRTPLVDWRQRVDYFCKRIEQFHQREFQGQSALQAVVHPEPLISELDTEQLRQGDADAIFFRTLGESERRTGFAKQKADAFPILLVLSEINWRPLDDFYRLRPAENGWQFEGNYSAGQHFPGATSGGARATYLADRGVGWGLVSADGWRVPYRGSDCVIYHEGCGHTVGLPHPDTGNGSVMSLGQYQGWINESWLDKDQKSRLQWSPAESSSDAQARLFSAFRAIPAPAVPLPDEPVLLQLDWPEGAQVDSLRVRFQTAVDGPWIEVPQRWDGDAPATAWIGRLDRATPVSYRVDAVLKDGATAELWGYFQVREQADRPPQPVSLSADLIVPQRLAAPEPVALASAQEEVDLLAMVDPARHWHQGDWSMADGILESPKAFGARIELPHLPPPEYRLTVIVQPLDEPNGLLFGHCLGDRRFVTLFQYAVPQAVLSAIENIDGRNVGNESTFRGSLFKKNQLSQLIISVRQDRIEMEVDGRTIIHWRGKPDRLSLSDYWTTPNSSAMFLGAYDCRYRFHRITLEPITNR